MREAFEEQEAAREEREAAAKQSEERTKEHGKRSRGTEPGVFARAEYVYEHQDSCE